jgi:hypothetical protein
MAGIRAEEVNRPREVRAYGLTPGIGGAHVIGWISTLRTKISIKSKSVNGWPHTMVGRTEVFWRIAVDELCLGYTLLEEFQCDNFA